MSIPVTASTEKYTPECMAEIEGAAAFTFRHATEIDKHRYHNLVIEEGLVHHNNDDLRQAIIDELRAEFRSEGMEHNITRLQAYWQALDDHDAAVREHREHVMAILAEVKEGDEKPDLPPSPEIDFPQDEITALDEIVDEVKAESRRIRRMLAQRHWYGVMMPRLLMRMYLVGTTLPVKLKKVDGIITAESAEAVIDALAKAARDAGVSDEVAIAQLQTKAMLAYTLTGDEEKNSSSPLSGSTTPEQSASSQSSGSKKAEPSTSSAPATSEEASGSISSE